MCVDRVAGLGVWLLALGVGAGHVNGALEVGLAKADITPDVKAKDVWIAGYGNGRKATGVHDRLWARAVVLRDGMDRVALVSVDLVGVQRPTVEAIRAKLPGYRHVLVSSTHQHEGPDVIGLWGPTRGETGVDLRYLEFLMDRVVESVREAEARLESAEARYGTAEDGSILSDGRLPIVKDGVLRVLEFRRPGGGAAIGVLVQWNCHPESLGRNNTLITADFPYYTVKALEDRRGCPVAYFTGAVGGLMSNPRDWKTRDGTVVHENTFEFAEAYGLSAATLAERALEGATPIELAPFRAASRLVMLPLANQGYRQARAAGVLPRQAFAWMGDAYVRGEPLAAGVVDGELAIESEVAYLRLGELHVAGIPGELYPELVYGEFQDPADLGADFIDALLEPPVMKTLPGPKAMLFGLANDEVGYIIPKRQWDEKTPFAYRRKDKQYGEVNSVGPEVAPILMKALEDCVRDMAQESRR